MYTPAARPGIIQDALPLTRVKVCTLSPTTTVTVPLAPLDVIVIVALLPYMIVGAVTCKSVVTLLILKVPFIV